MARKQSAQDVVSSSVAGVQAKVTSQLEDAKKRFISLEKELVKRGRQQQKELESLLKQVRGGAPIKQVEKSVNAASAEVKKRLDGLQGSVLGVLGVATHSEISKLNRELAKLSKKVDALVSTKKNQATA